jgi:hypothetical protein
MQFPCLAKEARHGAPGKFLRNVNIREKQIPSRSRRFAATNGSE